MPVSIKTSLYVFPLEDTSAVTAWLDRLTPVLPAAVEPFALLSGPVFGGDAPPEARFIVVGAIAYDDDEVAAEAALRPLQATPRKPLVAEHASPRKFEELFPMMDVLFPPGGPRMHCDAAWSDDGTQPIFGALEEHFKSCPSPLNYILCFQPPRIPLQDNACFSMMRTNCVVLYGRHESEDEDQANADWVAEGMKLLEQSIAGYWVNETDLTVGPARARRSLAPEAWERARKLRSSYDPDGLFADYLGTDS
jgi:hypothetical protein